MNFSSEFFQEFDFSKETIKKYLASGHKDLRIAREAKESDVVFQFSYNAFIELGISMIAVKGYKIKTRMGHHIRIINNLAMILEDEDIDGYGNSMRKTRNTELYDGGIIISEKQSTAYFKFVDKVFLKSEQFFNKYFGGML
ncbi:MAG: hypothetical protein PF572_03140 [Patescibacteria group bacterium]|jgi:hypothetical protein|nr:hypothetical protein [Patescibacteria group bacterium]